MPTLVADEYAEIAKRVAEINGEKRAYAGERTAASAYGIWFDPGDRDPGWCRINRVTGKWSVWRSGDAGDPSLFDCTEDAQCMIDSKQGGTWNRSDMTPRAYCS